MAAQSSSFPRRSTAHGLTSFDKPPVLTVAQVEHIQYSIPMSRELAHTSAEVTVVHDGVTFVARCACGSRLESMVHAHDYARCDTDDDVLDLMRVLGDAAPHAQIERWQRDHRGCASTSRSRVFPKHIRSFIEDAWRLSLEAIERGEHVYNLLYVILSDFQVHVYPLDRFRRDAQLDPEAGPLDAEHGAHADLREICRQTLAAPIAAITVAQTWVRSADGEAPTTTEGRRAEALRLWATTPTGGITRMASVVRAGEDGTAIVGQAVTLPLSVPCALLDGVLAKAVEVPESWRAR